MDNNQMVLMWNWACKQLGVSENASKDEIKKAFREKAKEYHPDSSKTEDTSMQYVCIQNAYEYLTSHTKPETQNYAATTRPAKVFGNDAKLNMQLRKQKEIEKSKRKAQNWVPKERCEEQKEIFQNNINENKMQTEEELLNRIRAILLAEHIKRQIEYDKQKKIAEEKTKLYRAFMQHQILEDADKDLDGNNRH